VGETAEKEAAEQRRGVAAQETADDGRNRAWRRRIARARQRKRETRKGIERERAEAVEAEAKQSKQHLGRPKLDGGYASANSGRVTRPIGFAEREAAT